MFKSHGENRKILTYKKDDERVRYVPRTHSNMSKT